MCTDEPNDRWYERGDYDQYQDDNGADDEAALSDPSPIFIPGDQANIAHRMLTSRSTSADCYGTLLFWRCLLWCDYSLS
jgi:hypothetical protein